MKNKNFILAFSILLLTMLACNTLLPSTDAPTGPTVSLQPQTQPQNNNAPQTEADVPRIPVSEAKAAFDSGQAIIVDVRDGDSYVETHATGAISIPLTVFEIDIENVSLEKNEWIITYCTWPNEHTSARAAFLMLHNGYTNVQALLGGLEAWIDAGYPTEP